MANLPRAVAGDEILEVNGHSLIGVSREGAIEFLKQVRFCVLCIVHCVCVCVCVWTWVV